MLHSCTVCFQCYPSSALQPSYSVCTHRVHSLLRCDQVKVYTPDNGVGVIPLAIALSCLTSIGHFTLYQNYFTSDDQISLFPFLPKYIAIISRFTFSCIYALIHACKYMYHALKMYSYCVRRNNIV